MTWYVFANVELSLKQRFVGLMIIQEGGIMHVLERRMRVVVVGRIEKTQMCERSKHRPLHQSKGKKPDNKLNNTDSCIKVR